MKKYRYPSNVDFKYHDSVSHDLHRYLFRFEYNIFSSIFALTSKTYEKYKELRPAEKLTVSIASCNGKIVSLILNEIINPCHCHCSVIATLPNYRRLGISQNLFRINIKNIKRVTKFISVWCKPDSPVKYILSEYSSILSAEPLLNDIELQLRQQYFKRRLIHDAKSSCRRNDAFYKTMDGEVLPAEFYILKV